MGNALFHLKCKSDIWTNLFKVLQFLFTFSVVNVTSKWRKKSTHFMIIHTRLALIGKYFYLRNVYWQKNAHAYAQEYMWLVTMWFLWQSELRKNETSVIYYVNLTFYGSFNLLQLMDINFRHLNSIGLANCILSDRQ